MKCPHVHDDKTPCSEKPKGKNKFCSLHDPEKPYVIFERAYGEIFKGHIGSYPKKEAEHYVLVGVAFFLKDLRKDDLLMMLDKLWQSYNEKYKDIISWNIKVRDDDDLLDWLGEKTEIEQIETIKELDLGLEDRKYLSALTGIPLGELVEFNLLGEK